MGSKLLHAKSQKWDKAKLDRHVAFILEMHTKPTTHFLSMKHTTMYVHFSPCLQQSLSPHVEKKPESRSWENELNHTHVNTKKLRKMFLPITKLHCMFV